MGEPKLESSKEIPARKEDEMIYCSAVKRLGIWCSCTWLFLLW
jgi:hypothetical protein